MPGLYRWLSVRLQYHQCVSNGDTAVLHEAIDIPMEDYSLLHIHGGFSLVTHP